MLLSSRIGPVSHSPAGTRTVPPPSFAHAPIAAANAAVFNVLPPGSAPWSAMLIVLAGNEGSRIAGIANGRPERTAASPAESPDGVAAAGVTAPCCEESAPPDAPEAHPPMAGASMTAIGERRTATMMGWMDFVMVTVPIPGAPSPARPHGSRRLRSFSPSTPPPAGWNPRRCTRR